MSLALSGWLSLQNFGTPGVTGWTVISELLWLVPVTVLWYSTVYRFVVRYEETHLLEKYGQPYRDYMSQVSRWLPRISSFSTLELRNKYFLASTLKEVHCLLIIVPYVLKEFVAHWFEH